MRQPNANDAILHVGAIHPMGYPIDSRMFDEVGKLGKNETMNRLDFEDLRRDVKVLRDALAHTNEQTGRNQMSINNLRERFTEVKEHCSRALSISGKVSQEVDEWGKKVIDIETNMKNMGGNTATSLQYYHERFESATQKLDSRCDHIESALKSLWVSKMNQPGLSIEYYQPYVHGLTFETIRLSNRVPEIEKPPTETLSFGECIKWLHRDWRITRKCWRNKNIYVYKHSDDELRFVTIQGKNYPWMANHSELLAGDWLIVPRDLSTASQENARCF